MTGSGRNGVDADFGVVLTMALTLLVVLATTHLEDLDLVVTALCKNGGFDRGAFNERRADFQRFAFADGQDLVERDFLPNVSRYLFDFQLLASANTILFAAGFYDRVHGIFL